MFGRIFVWIVFSSPRMLFLVFFHETSQGSRLRTQVWYPQFSVSFLIFFGIFTFNIRIEVWSTQEFLCIFRQYLLYTRRYLTKAHISGSFITTV